MSLHRQELIQSTEQLNIKAILFWFHSLESCHAVGYCEGFSNLSGENTPLFYYDLFSLFVSSCRNVGKSPMHYADISLDIAVTFRYYSVVSMETELHINKSSKMRARASLASNRPTVLSPSQYSSSYSVFPFLINSFQSKFSHTN